MKKIGIIGLGLMGGSLALAIKEHLPELEVAGYDKNDKHLQFSRSRDFIDKVLTLENMKEMDIIFLAIPVRSIPAVLSDIISDLNLGKTIITDLGSTKTYLYRNIRKEFPLLNYIGGHPMAGKEISGPEGAAADLFQDRNYILIKSVSEYDNYDLLISIIKRIGSRLIHLSADEHDRFVSLTSHLPQLLASSLINEVLDSKEDIQEISGLMGQGFLDLSRIAASDPEMWLDIFLTNKENIIDRIDGFIDQLKGLKEILITDKEPEIFNFLLMGKKGRVEIEKVKSDEINHPSS